MRNISSEFREALKNGNRRYSVYADITLKDGTKLSATNENLWQGGFSMEDSVSSSDSFDVGAAIINKFALTLNNIDDKYSKYDFSGAEGIVYAAVSLNDFYVTQSSLRDLDGQVILDHSGDPIETFFAKETEKIRMCTGRISDPPTEYSSILALTFYDNMTKFDRAYSESKLEYPATIGTIVRDACSVCGVTLQTVTFPHHDFVVQTRPNDEAITFREVISWCAQIAGCFCRCDVYGRLELRWFKYELLETQPEDSTELHKISTNYQAPTVSLDDVVITGVKVVEKNESEESGENLTSYQAGTDGYVITIENNELIKNGSGQTVAGWLGEQLIGFRFRKASMSHASDPSIEAGDVGILTDRKGREYRVVISSTRFSTSASQSSESSAKSPAINSAARYSSETKNYVNWRNSIKKEKTEREKALEELADKLANSPGVFTTVQTDSAGGKIFYLHNKPKLEESDMVWKMTAEAWGVSTDGGKTWNAGMTVDGDTIVRILTAVGVNADWINTGAITVRDSSGSTIFSVDMDTKKVFISGDFVQIGGKPAPDALDNLLSESKGYSDKKLADYANTVTKDMENLQAQVDGQVEDWYFDYEPSMQNKPASEWTTVEERRKHIGDRFFWKSKGYAYRFMENSGVWGWILLQDTDITKAMQAAQNAKDVADGKRRTFVTTPKPPYDIGDLWTNGADILTCTVARASGSSYVSSDWKKLNEYTDDTVANQALEEAKKAHNILIQLDNEYQGIPTDYKGNISAFPEVKTQVYVFYGHQDVSAQCTYTVQKSSSVSGTWDNTRRIYAITGLSADTGWVDITASYLGILHATKRFAVSKVKGGTPGPQGEDGIPGPPGEDGADGKTSYTHIAYANSADGTKDFSVSDSNRAYVGMYVDFEVMDSTAPQKYAWSKIKGADGTQGIPGKPGADGKTPYFHIAYANSADGTKDFSVSDSNRDYIGQYTDFVQNDSTDPAKYSWTKIKGEKGDQGIPGLKGDPGTVSRNYILESSDTVVKKTADNRLSPSQITFKAFYRDGNAASRTAYAGRFKIEESANGTSFSVKYTSAKDESAKSYAPSSADVRIIRCTLYAAGGTKNSLDTQTVVVLTDVSNVEVGGSNLVSKDDVQGLYETTVKRTDYTFDVSGTSHKEDGSYRGVFVPDTIFTVGESYVFSYKFSVKKGSVTKIGGHHDAFETVKAVVDGTEYNTAYTYGYPLDSKKTEHTVAVYLKYLGTGTDKKLYIQPNRQGGTDGSWNILLTEVQVKKGNVKTDWQPSLKDSLDSIQFGGRNMILNSTFNRQGYKWTATDVNGISYPKEGRDGSYCAKIAGKFNTDRNLQAEETYKVKAGEVYTLSGWTKSKDIVKGTTNYFVSLYMGFYDRDHKWKAEAAINNGQMPLSTDWEQNILTFTVPDVSGIDHMWIYLYARDFTGTIWWDDLQLEKGTRASDWSPAPEDAESLIITLSNEAHSITTDKNGNGGNFADCETTVQVYNGTQDVTAQTTYTVTKSSGITGAWDGTNHKYKVTALSTDNGYVDIKAVYNGISVVKRFTVSKSKTGATGADGKTTYFHIKYSPVQNPTASQMTETPNVFIGTYVDFTQADSTDPKKYTWYRFQGLQGKDGTQGIPGKNGTNGQTSYLHIKYSNDGGKTFTANTGETPGDYIGQYVDFTQADSTDPKKYSWSKTKGETGRTYFIELSANILKRGQNNKILPATVTAKAFYRDGSSAARTAYAGRWKIETSTNGVDYTTAVSSTANESSKSYSVGSLAANVVSVRFTLYAAGGLTTQLDMQSIPVVIDVDNLTHEQIFNLLTNNGAMKGIYQSGGQLYINGTYIRSLILTADMIQGKELASLGATLGGFIVESKRIRNTSSDGKKAMYMGSYDWNGSDFMVVQSNASGSWKNLLMLKYDGSLESRDNAQTALAQLNAGGLKFQSKDGSSWADDMVFNKNGMEGKRNKYCKVSVKADNADTLTSGAAAGWERNVLGDTRIYGELEVKTLKTTGTKKIVKQTQNYGEASFYCDETPTPLLSDYGEGTIASDGFCCVDIDDIFREAVNSNIQYFVFLQKEGPGDCWVKEKAETHFVVQGTPDLKFTWGIKVKQKGTEHLRFNEEERNLRVHSFEPETVMEAEQMEVTQQENEAMEQYAEWMFRTMKEMEDRYNEEINIIYES